MSQQKQLPNKGKLLALDLGTRRTGVAISDASQRVAFPRPEVRHNSTEELIVQLSAIVEKEEIRGVLAGMPINMKGEQTRQTGITIEIVNQIQAAFDLPIHLVDERMTSQEAHKNINQRVVDSEVARILLGQYLDAR